MKTKLLLFGILMFSFTLSFGQNNNHKNTWYFSNVTGMGLDFSSGTPVAISNGQAYTTEGISSISDKEGNLLFYTNGIDVYSADHNPMPTPSGVLWGNTSGSINTNIQGVNIICDSYNENSYYVFTIAGDISSVDSLFYFKVDMSLNGGMGDVVAGSATGLADDRSGSFTAVRHENNTDWFIITADESTDELEVLLLDQNGISPTPVYVGIGGLSNISFPNNNMLKASPTQEQIALVSWNSTSSESHLFDIDRTTGALTQYADLTDYTNLTANTGVEFSANGEVLYLGQMWKTGPFFDHSGIMQYDLSQPANQVESSRMRIDSVVHFGAMCMERGPDDKIYYHGEAAWPSYHIGAIENPNVVGYGCTSNETAVDVGMWPSMYIDLISFPQFFDGLPEADFDHGDLCDLTVDFTYDGPYNCTEWDFGDGSTDSSPNPTHTFSAEGTYDITLVAMQGCHCELDTVVKTITVYKAIGISITGLDDEVCEGQGPITLPTPTPAGGTWTGAGVTGQTFYPSVAGLGSHDVVYTYTNTTSGCAASDTVTITVSDCLGLDSEVNLNLSIYPNPTNGQLFVQLDNVSNQDVNIIVSDLSGRLLYNSITNGSFINEEIDLSIYETGIYLVSINLGDKTIVRKVSKL